MAAEDWVWTRTLEPRDEIDIAPTQADMDGGRSVGIPVRNLRTFIAFLETIRAEVEPKELLRDD